MKKIIAMVLALVMVFALVACGSSSAPAAESKPAEAPKADAPKAETPKAEEPAKEAKVFTMYAWNEEFIGFLQEYYAVEKDGKWYLPDGETEINFVITPNDSAVYQTKLDEALLNGTPVDLFLAESDYITKYADSEYTQDITKIGVTDMANCYPYTVQAASDADGVVKGVSFQCCPSALIYRRSIAKDVLGTDDPAEVQAKLDSWDKFEAVAADAKAKGYYMTASFAETYRVFSNNCSGACVEDNQLRIDPMIEAWIDQTDKFVENGYTLTAGIWDEEKNVQMFADGKTMCFFGPAWYFNFCMGNAMDPEKGCSGDWAICEGPAAHFWGGTWIMAPTNTQYPEVVAEIMNLFINDEDVCTGLIKDHAQFTNNKVVNAKFAEDPDYGSEFLGGQNDVAVFSAMTGNIVWQYHTIYDQLFNEGIQNALQEYWKGEVDKDSAMQNFYTGFSEAFPAIETP